MFLKKKRERRGVCIKICLLSEKGGKGPERNGEKMASTSWGERKKLLEDAQSMGGGMAVEKENAPGVKC